MDFKQGDWVILKQKLAGKTRTKATGPYQFIKYTSPLGVVAQVQSLAGKTIESSVSNMLLLRPGVRPLQKWKASLGKTQGIDVEQLWESDSDEEAMTDSEEE